MTAWLLDALFGWLGPLLAGLATVAGAWMAGRRSGARGERDAAREREAARYINTRRKMDEADIADDAAGAAEWLRRRDRDAR